MRIADQFKTHANRETYTGPVAQEYDEEVDIAALFPDPPRKRHKWGPQKFSGSFVQHSRVSTCICGLERHRQYDYGRHRTIFKAKDGFWHEKTPECTRDSTS